MSDVAPGKWSLPTVMHDFSRMPTVEKPRSSFNLTRKWMGTLDASYLVPCFVGFGMPGDTWNIRSGWFARMATPATAYMDNIFAEIFWFKIPYRIVWTNYRKFMGEQVNPGDSVDFSVPIITSPAGGYLEHTVYDYMGLPTKVAGFEHSAIPLRSYYKVWNAWIRDEDLQDSLTEQVDDGPDAPTDYVIQKRCKRPDYFTSGRPFRQKGTAAQFSIVGEADVRLNTDTGLKPMFRKASDHSVVWAEGIGGGGAIWGDNFPTGPAAGVLDFDAGVYVVYDPTPRGGGESTLKADLTSLGGSVTVEDLREAIMMQQYLETNARVGTRLPEILWGRFGVRSSDASLQIPEFIGSSSEPINVHPVPQTSATGATGTPQGYVSGFATSSGRAGVTTSLEEHCVILGIVNVRTDLTYQQGLPREWSARTVFDHYSPEFANLGSQAVLRKEIYCDGSANDADVFCYTPHWDHLRYGISQITGLFRSNATGSLDFYHCAEEFGTAPVFDETFITDPAVTTVDRVIAVPSQPQFLFDMRHEVTCARVMPTYSVPGLTSGRL